MGAKIFAVSLWEENQNLMKNILCQFEDVKGMSNELPRKSNTQSEWNEGHLTSLFGYHWREVSPVPLFVVSTLYQRASH